MRVFATKYLPIPLEVNELPTSRRSCKPTYNMAVEKALQNLLETVDVNNKKFNNADWVPKSMIMV